MSESAPATHSTGAAIVAPDRVHLLHPVHGRERQLVPRIGAQARACRRAAPRPSARRGTPPCRAAAADCSSAAGRRRRRGSRTARTLRLARARRATCANLSGARPASSAGMPKPSSETTRAHARRPHAGVDACTTLPPRLWPTRSTASPGAKRVAPAPRGRRRSRRTSSPAAATSLRPKPRSRARSRASRARARRPGTGTTRRRPSSRAAGRACGARGIAPRQHVVTRGRAARSRCERERLHRAPIRTRRRRAARRHFLLHSARPSCQPVR